MRQLLSIDYHCQMTVKQTRKGANELVSKLRHRFRSGQHWMGRMAQYSLEMIVAIHEQQVEIVGLKLVSLRACHHQPWVCAV